MPSWHAEGNRYGSVIARTLATLRRLQTLSMYVHLLCGNREIFVSPWGNRPQGRIGKARGRSEEVRLIDSTCEASEQSGAIHCGVGGGRRWDQEQCGTAKHGPDAESGSLVTSAGSHTRSCNQEREGETDSALASRQHRRPAVGLL
jgi:hypothetical protein